MTNNDQPPRKILGLRAAALLEMVSLLLFLVICDFLFSDGTRFINVYPHPFWAVVLLITFQHGIFEGLAATAIATFVLYFGNVPKQLVEESTFDYQFRLFFRPCLWVFVAFLVGQLRRRLQNRIDQLVRERDEAREQALTITKRYGVLKNAKENLESRFVGQVNTVASTYDSVRGLETLNPVQILTCLDQVVQAAFNPKKFSVFASGPNGLEATTSQGWTADDHFTRRFPVDHPLCREIVQRKRLVCIINKENEEVLEGEGIVAGPLVDRRTGEVFGMIKVEEIDFFRLDIGGLETFKTLCELIGSAYSNAIQYKLAKQNAIYEEERGIFSAPLYSLVKRFLGNLCKMTKVPLSNLLIKLQLEEQVEEERAQEIASAIYDTLRGQLSEETPIFHGKGKFTYEMLLPTLEGAATEQLSIQLLAAFQHNPILASYTFTFKVEQVLSIQPQPELQYD